MLGASSSSTATATAPTTSLRHLRASMPSNLEESRFSSGNPTNTAASAARARMEAATALHEGFRDRARMDKEARAFNPVSMAAFRVRERALPADEVVRSLQPVPAFNPPTTTLRRDNSGGNASVHSAFPSQRVADSYARMRPSQAPASAPLSTASPSPAATFWRNPERDARTQELLSSQPSTFLMRPPLRFGAATPTSTTPNHPEVFVSRDRDRQELFAPRECQELFAPRERPEVFETHRNTARSAFLNASASAMDEQRELGAQYARPAKFRCLDSRERMNSHSDSALLPRYSMPSPSTLPSPATSASSIYTPQEAWRAREREREQERVREGPRESEMGEYEQRQHPMARVPSVLPRGGVYAAASRGAYPPSQFSPSERYREAGNEYDGRQAAASRNGMWPRHGAEPMRRMMRPRYQDESPSHLRRPSEYAPGAESPSAASSIAMAMAMAKARSPPMTSVHDIQRKRPMRSEMQMQSNKMGGEYADTMPRGRPLPERRHLDSVASQMYAREPVSMPMTRMPAPTRALERDHLDNSSVVRPPQTQSRGPRRVSASASSSSNASATTRTPAPAAQPPASANNSEPKRRCGRKSMNYSSEQKRERNRAAVKKCRQRQALKLEYLRRKAQVLQSENRALSEVLAKHEQLDEEKRMSLTRGIQMDILLKIKEIFTQSLPKDFVLDADSIWDLNSVLAVSMPSRCYYGIESIKDFWRTSLRMRNKGKIRSFWAWLFRLPPGDRFSDFSIESFGPTSNLYFIHWTTKSSPPLSGSIVIMFGRGHRVTLHVEVFGWLIWRYLLTNTPFPEPPLE